MFHWYCIYLATKHNHILHTLVPVPSGPPLNFFIEATTSRTLYFSWEPPLLEQQNGVIVGYTVNIVPDDNSMMFQLYSDEHATNLSAKIFKPYTVYRCAVAAFTTPGTGPYSDEVVILTPEDSNSVYNITINSWLQTNN